MIFSRYFRDIFAMMRMSVVYLSNVDWQVLSVGCQMSSVEYQIKRIKYDIQKLKVKNQKRKSKVENRKSRIKKVSDAAGSTEIFSFDSISPINQPFLTKQKNYLTIAGQSTCASTCAFSFFLSSITCCSFFRISACSFP